MLLSVVVPIYNSSLFLERCLDSIMRQSFSDFELILVDDGSTDNSLSICQNYASRFSNIILISQVNGGVSSARNLGIDLSNGKYITFIDSDDWIEKDYFSKFFIQDISEYILIYQSTFATKDTMFSKRHFSYNDCQYSSNNNWLDFNIKILLDGCPHGKLFANKIIKSNRIKFNSKITLHEDHLFVFEYIKYVDKIITMYYAGYHYMDNVNHISLTKKMHSANNLLYASNLFFKNYEQLKNKFNVCDLSLLYTHYGFNQQIRALYNSLILDDILDFKDIVIKIRNSRSVLHPRNYSNKYLVRKLSLYIIHYSPICFMLVLYTISKNLNKNKR